MVVFQNEWKRSRKYIGIWAAVLALCIFSMTPIYYRMIGTVGELPLVSAEGGFFEMAGLSLEQLKTSLGMYSFLTSFFMIAGGIFGIHLGMSLYTRECTEHTAEFLFTKPCGRAAVYWAKTACLLCGVAAAGACYLAASYLAMRLFNPGFPLREFVLVAVSFALVTLFFGALGLLLGNAAPRNRSPLLTAGLTVFMEYCVREFSVVMGWPLLGYLSPFSFFAPSAIHAQGAYEWNYLLWCLFLVAAFLALSYRALLKRDIAFVA